MIDANRTLTQMVSDHRSLDQLMIETGGELTDAEQESIVDGWMSEIRSNIEQKADNYEWRMRSLEDASERLRARAKMIGAAAKVLENMSESLKDRMKMAMQEMGVTELTGNDFKFKLSAGKSSVVVTDKNLLPASYMRETLTIVPDMDAIKIAIDANTEVPGAELKTTTTLRVSANKKMKEIK